MNRLSRSPSRRRDRGISLCSWYLGLIALLSLFLSFFFSLSLSLSLALLFMYVWFCYCGCLFAVDKNWYTLFCAYSQRDGFPTSCSFDRGVWICRHVSVERLDGRWLDIFNKWLTHCSMIAAPYGDCKSHSFKRI